MKSLPSAITVSIGDTHFANLKSDIHLVCDHPPMIMSAIAQSGTVGQAVHLCTGYLQPIASDDVAAAMTEVALGLPVNGAIEIAGPERAPLSEFVGRFLKAANDPREVVADAHAPYFGLELDDRSLVPGDNPRVGATRFDDWLGQSTRQK